jgi:hypothetical protein
LNIATPSSTPSLSCELGALRPSCRDDASNVGEGSSKRRTLFE